MLDPSAGAVTIVPVSPPVLHSLELVPERVLTAINAQICLMR